MIIVRRERPSHHMHVKKMLLPPNQINVRSLYLPIVKTVPPKLTADNRRERPDRSNEDKKVIAYTTTIS